MALIGMCIAVITESVRQRSATRRRLTLMLPDIEALAMKSDGSGCDIGHEVHVIGRLR